MAGGGGSLSNTSTRVIALCLAAGLIGAFGLSLIVGSFLPDALPTTTSGRPHNKKKKRFSGLRRNIGEKAKRIKTAIKDEFIHRGNHKKRPGLEEDRKGRGKHRIAIVIPYLSSASDQSFPPYFDLFVQSAGGSAALIDFLIFHTGLPSHILPDPTTLPSNVKLIDLQSSTRLAELLVRVTDRRTDESLATNDMDRTKLVGMITKAIEHHPYILVEYKPATGHIFAEYLTEYSHWGYSDLDIIWGDTPRWVTQEELTDWDIVTYSFGDQDRVYLRGQFTFHKNIDRINQLWRGCEYLSQADVRYSKLMKGSEQFKLESAEGCYSATVLNTNDIRVKYSVKALTDAEGAGAESANIYGLYVGLGRNRDRSVVWTAGNGEDDGHKLLGLPIDWFEDSDTAFGYTDVNNPLQWEVGERKKITSYRDKYGDDGEFKKCMYWAPKTYQRDICAINVDWFKDTVMLINGELYKQRFERYAFPNNVVSYPFFHFQEWKRYFRRGQLRSVEGRMAVDDLAGWVISENGATPFPQDITSRPDSAMARISQWVEAQERGVSSAAGDVEAVTSLPSTKYCLRFSPHKIGGPKLPAVVCDEPVSWRDEGTVVILAAGEGWSGWSDPITDVTLALTAQIVLTGNNERDQALLDGLLDVAESSMAAWSIAHGDEQMKGQPSIFLLHIAGATRGFAERVHQRFQKGTDGASKPYLDSSLVAAIFSEKRDAVSRNALLNMAAEASATRWVVSGLEVERGLVISKEASLFARRIAGIHAGVAGSAFVVPQFGASKDTAAAVSVTELLRDMSSIQEDLSYLDCAKCSVDVEKQGDIRVGDVVVQKINCLWKDATKSDLGMGEIGVETNAVLEATDSIKALLVQLLHRGQSKAFRHFDQSPIIMIDSLGPIDGSITSQVVPAAEELAGSRCYNALRLAQLAMLGYNLEVLPGAFAASTKSTRKSVCMREQDGMATTGAAVGGKELVLGSRCSACFMYKNDDVLRSVAMDERARVAEAAVLWSELAARASDNER